MLGLSHSFLQTYKLPTPRSSQLVPFTVSCVKFDERISFPDPTHPLDDQTEQRKTNFKKQDPLSWHNNIFNSLDNFICKFIDPPLRPSIDPKHVLSGNFSPVPELPPTACDVVEGTLPRCLDGAYIRNGPNPQFIPRGPHHLFDGDGMLHSIRIHGGKATFCSRFTKTYKYEVEREIGGPVILNFFSCFNGIAASIARFTVNLGRLLAGEYDPRRGIGTANTSLALFGGKSLFALGESDLPYRIKITPDGDIVTLGRHEPFGAQLTTMTAHPKTDPESGEAFAFRQSITFMKPFLVYFKIDKRGEKRQEVPIFSLPHLTPIHDFAVSKKYAVFPDTQIVVNLKSILKGMPVISVDPKKVPRLGIIPRDALDETEMFWVEVPGLNIVHAVNAWDDEDGGGGETIVMMAPNLSAMEHILDRPDLIHSCMERIEINVNEKIVKRQILSAANLDFGVINPGFVGKKNRYVYAGIGAPLPKTSGVMKIDTWLSTPDVDDCTVASRLYGPNRYGGEAIFVPRDPEDPTPEEDDGYLITYIHDEITRQSEFIVMDAKSLTLEIIAVVRLPGRVPYGFHGIFVPEFDLQNCNINPN